MPKMATPLNTAWARDTAERVVRTFLATFVAQIVASGALDVGGITDVSLWEKAAVAGLASVATLVLSLLGGSIGDPATASLVATRSPNPIAAGRAEPVHVEAPSASEQIAQLGTGHGYAAGGWLAPGQVTVSGAPEPVVHDPAAARAMRKRDEHGRYAK
jgi:hypothetical protein